MNWKTLTGSTKTAAVCAILGFFIGITSTSTSNINGVVTCSHNDFGALALGVIAILAGLAGMRGAPAGTARTPNMVIAGIAALVGVLHVLRGFGMVGGPCG